MKIKKFVQKERPLICLTANNIYTAQILDDFCDLILVGDSLGMVVYGEKTTRKVTIDTMINHGKAVRKGIKKSKPRNRFGIPRSVFGEPRNRFGKPRSKFGIPRNMFGIPRKMFGDQTHVKRDIVYTSYFFVNEPST